MAYKRFWNDTWRNQNLCLKKKSVERSKKSNFLFIPLWAYSSVQSVQKNKKKKTMNRNWIEKYFCKVCKTMETKTNLHWKITAKASRCHSDKVTVTLCHFILSLLVERCQTSQTVQSQRKDVCTKVHMHQGAFYHSQTETQMSWPPNSKDLNKPWWFNV